MGKKQQEIVPLNPGTYPREGYKVTVVLRENELSVTIKSTSLDEELQKPLITQDDLDSIVDMYIGPKDAQITLLYKGHDLFLEKARYVLSRLGVASMIGGGVFESFSYRAQDDAELKDYVGLVFTYLLQHERPVDIAFAENIVKKVSESTQPSN